MYLVGKILYECVARGCYRTFPTWDKMAIHNAVDHEHDLTDGPRDPRKRYEEFLKLNYHRNHISKSDERLVRDDGKSRGEKQVRNELFCRYSETKTRDGVEKIFCTADDCGAAFLDRYNFTRHLEQAHKSLLRSPERPEMSARRRRQIEEEEEEEKKVRHPCKNCGKCVTQKSMYRHRKACTSNGARNFRCKVKGCDAAFTIKSNMDSHVRQVHGPPKECPYPGCKARVVSSQLSRHIKLVHDKVKQMCDQCGRAVLYTNFKKHLERCKFKRDEGT